jgi:hypothetical protein
MILENDVLATERFVSFHQDNYYCYSNEFIKLYQIICSEIDVVCKKYCQYICDKKKVFEKYKNINDYARIILQEHSELKDQKISISSDLEFTPWKEWNGASGKYKSPDWWIMHNNIKHKRTDKDNKANFNYQHANLKNVLNSLAALCLLEKYFYSDLAEDEANVAQLGKISNTVITPYSKLFGFLELEKRYLVFEGI